MSLWRKHVNYVRRSLERDDESGNLIPLKTDTNCYKFSHTTEYTNEEKVSKKTSYFTSLYVEQGTDQWGQTTSLPNGTSLLAWLASETAVPGIV